MVSGSQLDDEMPPSLRGLSCLGGTAATDVAWHPCDAYYGRMAAHTYVVRLDLPDEASDFKAYAALPDARKRFRPASRRVMTGDLRGAFLFEVPGVADARAAINLVKAGKAVLIDRDPWEWIMRIGIPQKNRSDRL